MSRLSLAVEQIDAAREYTLRLLDHVPPADWFRQPAERVSHIAWQVGHLAIAEYWLTLQLTRGRRPEDAALIPDGFAARFGRETVPDPDPVKCPSPDELRAVLDRVHQHVLREVPQLTEAELDEPARKPHPFFTTKAGALFFCPQHEMVHAGQVGLLRRLLGHAPLW
jgi:uncharacterized damage-inducible protein DinB